MILFCKTTKTVYELILIRCGLGFLCLLVPLYELFSLRLLMHIYELCSLFLLMSHYGFKKLPVKKIL